ncbi:hypothetical protein HS088_TW14G00917 [Tripterygium wilfordii]|uniref:Uncharacterized protein n=1 Tax=Tripterygium wilfordii TaxID=458696 RepID=A0A7J7CRT7_TRIWF|nr:uncharacterized protein At4g14450, chloroplastic-like [Tripterygium wilfordii]KAF5736764.1 hypothetical protein HS088_TW14G00917 [Tripterygium wilfordii]
MADSQRNSSSRIQQSRLQRRRPATLQVNRAPEWNVAIPLLSPLATSPKAVEIMTDLPRQKEPQQRMEPEKPVAFKKWQHPAAPFFYEPPQLRQAFAPV